MDATHEVIARLLGALDSLRIPYAIGGSYASSAYGAMRATNDIDIVADVQPQHAPQLASALADEFYVAEEAILDALAHRTSFNVIHYDTMFKTDIFVAATDQHRHALLRRRRPGPLGDRTYPMLSPEDVVIVKLDWYRMGGGVSDQQWRDVLGVLVAQSGRLDMAYLHGQAEGMGLTALLEEALREADEAAS